MTDARYFNRDLSWIDFNERILEEGLRRDLLPLERFKYLSIVDSNFDEFFMVRVAAAKQAQHNLGESAGTEAGHEYSPRDNSGRIIAGYNDALQNLETIGQKVRSIMARQYKALKEEIFPGLAEGGLCLVRPADWTSSQREYLESLFQREILPLLTPLRMDDEVSFPSIGNLWIHVAFLLENIETSSADNASKDSSGKISIIRIPPILDRIILLPSGYPPGGGAPAGDTADNYQGEKTCWALLEDLVLSWGHLLYPGYRILESLAFRINRDADFSVDEQRDEDFIEAMEEVLEDREKSMVVRMVYAPGSRRLRDYFASLLDLDEEDLYEIEGPLYLKSLADLVQIRGFDGLREKPWKIYPHPDVPEDAPIWDRINEGDLILHVPYQSFDPVIKFFRDAASDPQVVSIKTTLYRTSENSPIIRALEQASLAGKHVTAVVELKARFDEGRNISWAYQLEKAGVIVVYGLARLKVHAKATLVMRREQDRLRRYVHLSTGNYNDRTAKLYEDISLFTAREEIAYDTGLLFNMITGYSVIQSMRSLAIAPTTLKARLLYLIERETSHSSPEAPGRIMAKMNSLADTDIIDALYRASEAGVQVLLNVRGICMLIPGLPGLSEHIRVVSVIDHYLEHSRICYFANGGAEELYLSSADWMPRNLERRVELMFPVLQEDAKEAVLEMLRIYFRDNSHAWVLGSGGAWERPKHEDEKPFRAQTRFLDMAKKASDTGASAGMDDTEFIIRRSFSSRL